MWTGWKRNKASLSSPFQGYFQCRPFTLASTDVLLRQKMSPLMLGTCERAASRSVLLRVAGKNSPALRLPSSYWPWREPGIACTRNTKRDSNFFFFFLHADVSERGYFSARPEGPDTGGEGGDGFSSLPSVALTGFPTGKWEQLVCVSQCLASRNPSNRAPFRGRLEDEWRWWAGRGRGRAL